MRTNYLIYSALIIATLASCKQEYSQDKPTITTTKRVAVQELTTDTEPIALLASGVLASESEMNLSFKVGGIVETVLVREGQTVKRGQLLARLDLAEINAQVSQARNAFVKAERDLKRADNLYRDTVATLEQKQNAETAFEVAQADLEIAEFNQRYATVVAPVTGKILKKMVEPSELVSPGQPLFMLGSSGTQGAQVIKIGLADKDIVQVALGDSAQISFDAFPQRMYPARVTEIAEAANPATGTFEVELTLDEQFFPELKNGFVGKVALYPSLMLDHIKIPMAALVEGDKKEATVFVSTDRQTVKRKKLPITSIHSDYFTVNETLIQPSTWIVLDGNAYLNDLDSITISNAQLTIEN
ncbi:MAG: efflux RND transporter periplasmic adaptor subunit [Tunicatimonas sp.]|uniref:efflux RND transporter periplasmic adaptor subunit n=1 Tax=Tunicatimonas sp. TaxID=1940096 RepID=UPI003C70D1AC